VASLSQGRTAAAQCGLFTYKSVPVIFEPPCTCWYHKSVIPYMVRKICQEGFARSHELMRHRLTGCWDVGAGPTNLWSFNHL